MTSKLYTSSYQKQPPIEWTNFVNEVNNHYLFLGLLFSLSLCSIIVI